MKIRRHKKLHRYMTFYCNALGFRQPYQVLIDGTFCYAALQNKFNIREQMPKYLEGDVKLLTTQCVILEAEKLGPALFGALVIVKQFALHRCGHDTPVVASECFKSMIGTNNPNRYIIATQDRELQEVVRKVPGTPLLYLHHRAPTLERPSHASFEQAKVIIAARFSLSEAERLILNNLSNEAGREVAREVIMKKKKKKGPNPLSCKKKKKKSDTDRVEKQARRKRKRIKIPRHLKEELHAELQKLSLNKD